MCLEVERLLSYSKDFNLKKENRSVRVLVTWTAKCLSTKICLCQPSLENLQGA